MVLNAGVESEAESIQRVLQFLYEKGILPETAMYQLCGQPVRQLFVIDEAEKRAIIEDSQADPVIEISEVDLQWLQTLAEGWASPLSGFMRERQYLQSLHFSQIFDLKKKCTIPQVTVWELNFFAKNLYRIMAKILKTPTNWRRTRPFLMTKTKCFQWLTGR